MLDSCHYLMCLRCIALQAYASALKQAQDDGQADPPLAVGFTYELCAGIIDKEKPLAQIAAEEVQIFRHMHMHMVAWCII